MIRASYIHHWKDYYEILDVGHKADEAEIKKAFRRLSRKYHPDNPEARELPDAEEVFKDIAEAYEYLSDATKRKEYDRFTGRNGHATSEAELQDEPGDLTSALTFRSVITNIDTESAAKVHAIVLGTAERIEADGGNVVDTVFSVASQVAPAGTFGCDVLPQWALNNIAGSSDRRLETLKGRRELSLRDVRRGVKGSARALKTAVTRDIKLNEDAIAILKIAAYQPLVHPITVTSKNPGRCNIFEHLDQATLQFVGLPPLDTTKLHSHTRWDQWQAASDSHHRAIDFIRPIAGQLANLGNYDPAVWYASVEERFGAWRPSQTAPTAIPSEVEQVFASAIEIAERETEQLRSIVAHTKALQSKSGLRRVTGTLARLGPKRSIPEQTADRPAAIQLPRAME